MANPEHLKVLKQGVGRWNEWRGEHPYVRADLSGAALHELNLREVDFRKTDLGGAVLRGANLREADLREATLREASLRDADLRGADLSRADLTVANLYGASASGANLSRAQLTRADLSWADLRGANITEAIFSGASLHEADLREANFMRADLRDADFNGSFLHLTVLADVDLRTAKKLETARHGGPSSIGIDTIYKSRGKIPEAFLRGCGLQDWEIEFVKLYRPDSAAADFTTILYRVSELRSGAPVRYSSCFISYSTKDQEFAERFHADLQAKGVRCWFAPEEMKGGRKLHEQIDEAIRLHDKLLLILSEHSMNSNWVKTEIANAREREKREGKQLLFPITLVPFEAIKQWKLLDADIGIDSAREIREYFIPDFSNWKDHDSYQTAFQRLVSDLKAEASK
jgi:uncharacterized protein YjbI with pentapeptide repeats